MTLIRLASGEEGAAEASSRGDLVLLIDALRATTTIVTALAHGVREVMPVASVHECTGELTAGERNGRKLPGVHLDNSPRSFIDRSHAGKRLTLTTTNGTRCLKAAGENPEALVLIAALVNLSSAASSAQRVAEYYGKDIAIIAAGRLRGEAAEDILTAGLLKTAIESGDPPSISAESSGRHLSSFLQSSSGRNLVGLGLHEDVFFCAQQDLFNLTPVYREGVCRVLDPFEPPVDGYSR
jgi:2-phosphosulfolactate phosphatase